jgi:hypothetical protein
MFVPLHAAAKLFGYTYSGMKQYVSKYYAGSVRTKRINGLWHIETDDLHKNPYRKSGKIQLPKAKNLEDYRKMVARSEMRNK